MENTFKAPGEIILKVVSRCNLFCTYCHWFRDPEVGRLPPFMQQSVVDAFLKRLRAYLAKYSLPHLSIIFHGGEPLLFPMSNFQNLITETRKAAGQQNCDVTFGLTTNGTLINRSWADFLLENKISVSVSIDGPKHIHDSRRVDLKGNGSFARTVAGIEMARAVGLEPTFLTVCDPRSDPHEVVSFMVDELKAQRFDVLIPSHNHNDRRLGGVAGISHYYIRLLDLWLDNYSHRGVRIRFLESLIRVLLGHPSRIWGLGSSPQKTIEILPNGAIEPHDVLRIGGNKLVHTGLSVFNHELWDLFDHELFYNPYKASQNAPRHCEQCRFVSACAGGDIVHRYSDENGFNNPSVYCDDLVAIYGHARRRLSQILEVN